MLWLEMLRYAVTEEYMIYPHRSRIKQSSRKALDYGSWKQAECRLFCSPGTHTLVLVYLFSLTINALESNQYSSCLYKSLQLFFLFYSFHILFMTLSSLLMVWSQRFEIVRHWDVVQYWLFTASIRERWIQGLILRWIVLIPGTI